MCPDYLTFVPKIPGSNSANRGGCVDLLGMTKTSSGLKTVTQSDIPYITSADTSPINIEAGGNYVILATAQGGPASAVTLVLPEVTSGTFAVGY